jgi:hypothetical protein
VAILTVAGSPGGGSGRPVRATAAGDGTGEVGIESLDVRVETAAVLDGTHLYVVLRSDTRATGLRLAGRLGGTPGSDGTDGSDGSDGWARVDAPDRDGRVPWTVPLPERRGRGAGSRGRTDRLRVAAVDGQGGRWPVTLRDERPVAAGPSRTDVPSPRTGERYTVGVTGAAVEVRAAGGAPVLELAEVWSRLGYLGVTARLVGRHPRGAVPRMTGLAARRPRLVLVGRDARRLVLVPATVDGARLRATVSGPDLHRVAALGGRWRVLAVVPGYGLVKVGRFGHLAQDPSAVFRYPALRCTADRGTSVQPLLTRSGMLALRVARAVG